MTDASMCGFGKMERAVDEAMAEQHGQFDERWRFKMDYEQVDGAESRGAPHRRPLQ